MEQVAVEVAVGRSCRHSGRWKGMGVFVTHRPLIGM